MLPKNCSINDLVIDGIVIKEKEQQGLQHLKEMQETTDMHRVSVSYREVKRCLSDMEAIFSRYDSPKQIPSAVALYNNLISAIKNSPFKTLEDFRDLEQIK